MTACSPLLFAALLLPIAGPAEAPPAAGDWNQWRGPQRDGRVAFDLPASLDEPALKETWRVPLGASYSGPVVGPDGKGGARVYTTETVGNTFETAKAFDAATGDLVWEAKWEGSFSVPFFAKANGDWIRSTPALDVDENGEGTLYVAGMRDVLAALDAATGGERWRVDFAALAGTKPETFGHVASPLVQTDADGEKAVYAHTIAGFSKLDAATGEVLWTVLDRTVDDDGEVTTNEGAFSSPVAATIAGVPQIVVQTRTELCGVNPSDGFGLWHTEVEAFRGMNVLTPVVLPVEGDGDAVRLLTSTYGGGTTLRKVRRSGGLWIITTFWENNRQGYMSSPVVVDGYAYQHLKNDRVVCFDLTDGEAAWTSKPFGGYWSMITDGDRILALDADGDLILIAADPTGLKVLGERRVTDATSWAHVAATPDRVFVRALDELIAYEY